MFGLNYWAVVVAAVAAFVVGAVQLGLWVGLGFQAMLLIGAVIHENIPWKLHAIHAGDAIVKTLFMAIILGVWR